MPRLKEHHCNQLFNHCNHRLEVYETSSKDRRGFTLVEMILGAAILVIVLAAFMGGFFGQAFLNSRARNLTAAMNDATRVMERIRQQNTGSGCATPDARPPGTFTSWNAWLTDTSSSGGGGMSINSPALIEQIVVTCQDGSSTATPAPYCGPDQVGASEWQVGAGSGFDPIRVTVAVGWYEPGRTQTKPSPGQEFEYVGGSTGGCAPATPGSLRVGTDTDVDKDGVIESQAMLTTLVTCRN